MLLGIRDKPYIDLDSHIPIKELTKLHLDICKGLAISGDLHPTYFPAKTKNRTYKEMRDAANHSDPLLAKRYKKIFKGLNSKQKLRFAELANDVLLSGSMLYLRSPENGKYRNTYDRRHCRDTHYVDNFPSLMDYIYKQLPFQSIGRIIIFVSNPGIEGQIHRDIGNNPEGRNFSNTCLNKHVYEDNHFIWMNPGDKKKFFVYDEEADKKHYIKSTSCMFNSNDFHGSDISNVTTYSIRVDGKFDNEFRRKIGL